MEPDKLPLPCLLHVAAELVTVMRARAPEATAGFQTNHGAVWPPNVLPADADATRALASQLSLRFGVALDDAALQPALGSVGDLVQLVWTRLAR